MPSLSWTDPKPSKVANTTAFSTSTKITTNSIHFTRWMMIYLWWYNLGSISARLWFRSLRLCCAWVAVGLRMLLGGSCAFWLVRSCSGKLSFLCGMIRNGWRKPLRTFRLSLFCVTISHLRFGSSCHFYRWSWSARDSLKLSAKKEKRRKPNKKQSQLDYLYDRSILIYIYTNLWSIKSWEIFFRDFSFFCFFGSVSLFVFFMLFVFMFGLFMFVMMIVSISLLETTTFSFSSLIIETVEVIELFFSSFFVSFDFLFSGLTEKLDPFVNLFDCRFDFIYCTGWQKVYFLESLCCINMMEESSSSGGRFSLFFFLLLFFHLFFGDLLIVSEFFRYYDLSSFFKFFFPVFAVSWFQFKDGLYNFLFAFL